MAYNTNNVLVNETDGYVTEMKDIKVYRHTVRLQAHFNATEGSISAEVYLDILSTRSTKYTSIDDICEYLGKRTNNNILTPLPCNGYAYIYKNGAYDTRFPTGIYGERTSGTNVLSCTFKNYFAGSISDWMGWKMTAANVDAISDTVSPASDFVY